MNVLIGILRFSDIKLHAGLLHKLRGFVGNLFKEYDLIHNHDNNSGKSIYRYPLIQFKQINGAPAIVAITKEGIDVFKKIFMDLNEINIDGRVIPVNEKELKVKEVELSFSDSLIEYEFMSPWVGLNQINFRKYNALSTFQDKKSVLNGCLTGNILSISKYLGYWLSEDMRIEVDTELSRTEAKLKGKSVIGFRGHFRTNFIIPDNLGLGKSVSRGYGNIRRLK